MKRSQRRHVEKRAVARRAKSGPGILWYLYNDKEFPDTEERINKVKGMLRNLMPYPHGWDDDWWDRLREARRKLLILDEKEQMEEYHDDNA